MIMPDFDYGLLLFGLLTGGIAAALFFAGLALGMRLALRAVRPVAVLLPSAALRIALLIGAGWWVAGQGAVAAVGFVIAFFVVRLVLLSALRPGKTATSLRPDVGVTARNTDKSATAGNPDKGMTGRNTDNRAADLRSGKEVT